MRGAASQTATDAAVRLAGPGARCFSALAATLAEQLDAARRGDTGAVLELARRSDTLLREARALGASPDPACRRRLVRLHDRVRLALAQQQEELLGRCAQLGRARDTLQAYRNAGSLGQRGMG